MKADTPVAVIGGGWAGLAAAVDLSAQGHRVCLLEARRSLGGRARSIVVSGTELDNGQHLMLGAYKATLNLLTRLGVDPFTVMERHRLCLYMRRRGMAPLSFSVAPLPAPFNLLGGMLRCQGLSLGERSKTVLAISRFLASRPSSRGMQTAAAALVQVGTPASAQRDLFAPLCLAALNIDLDRADANLFRDTLRRVFLSRRSCSDLLIPSAQLTAIVAEPALHYLERQGVDLRLGVKVTGLKLDDGGVRAVQVSDSTVPVKAIVIAANPVAAQRLLPPAMQTAFSYRRSPICTVYLKYPEPVNLEAPMVGLVGYRAQWLFDRSVCHQPGWIAAVISGWGPEGPAQRTELEARVTGELERLYPDWPPPMLCRAITERHATYRATPEAERTRPAYETGIPGLLLAGDYTATGLPATLEGAVESGVQCAKLLAQCSPPRER